MSPADTRDSPTPDQPAVISPTHEPLEGRLERMGLTALGYPPFRHLVRLLVSGPDAGGPMALLSELRAGLEGSAGDFDLLGPAPLLRLRGRHRAQLVEKAHDPRPGGAQAARLLESAARPMRRDALTAAIDVDPQSL